MYRTKDQVASEFIAEGKGRNITARGIVICIATGLVESNLTVYANAKVAGSVVLPHDAVGSDGMSVGPLQQQVVMGNGWWWGPVEVCQDPTGSAGLFYDRLAKKNYQAATTDAAAGAIAQSIQGSAFPDRYQQRMADAQAIYDRLAGAAAVTQPADPRIARLLAVRPDFNEFANWCQRADGKANWQDRDGTTIDAFLVHTQEAGDTDSAALDLSNFLKGTIGGPNPVSYHDSVRQASDGGVTVVNSVDTDLAAWSVGNSNNRSINRCFAGSSASWTREKWLTQSKAIDVMAYLMVLDAVKYNSTAPTHVTFGPNYDGKPPPVFSDHRYCTKVLKDGNNHVDCGDNFPGDVYGASVAKYWAAANATTTTPEVPAVPAPKPVGPADDQVSLRWNCLGGQTLVEAVAELRDKIVGTEDRDKTGAV